MEKTGELGRKVWRVGVKGDAVGSRVREECAGEEKEVFSRETSRARAEACCGIVAS